MEKDTSWGPLHSENIQDSQLAGIGTQSFHTDNVQNEIRKALRMNVLNSEIKEIFFYESLGELSSIRDNDDFFELALGRFESIDVNAADAYLHQKTLIDLMCDRLDAMNVEEKELMDSTALKTLSFFLEQALGAKCNYGAGEFGRQLDISLPESNTLVSLSLNISVRRKLFLEEGAVVFFGPQITVNGALQPIVQIETTSIAERCIQSLDQIFLETGLVSDFTETKLSELEREEYMNLCLLEGKQKKALEKQLAGEDLPVHPDEKNSGVILKRLFKNAFTARK